MDFTNGLETYPKGTTQNNMYFTSGLETCPSGTILQHVMNVTSSLIQSVFCLLLHTCYILYIILKLL